MPEAKHDRAERNLVPVDVWDWPVRIFHWLLVALVATSWITSEIGGNAMAYHMWSGYTILTLVVFRILWGFVGSAHARFGSFVKGPVAAFRYASGLMGSNPQRFLGHNPLGGWSVLLMLLSIGVQAVTGLFANDEIFTEGPLASRVSGDTSGLLTTVHRYNFYVLLTLIVLHLVAVLFYLLVKRENLIGAMFTGRKYVAHEMQVPPSKASAWLAAVIVVVVAALVAAVVSSA